MLSKIVGLKNTNIIIRWPAYGALLLLPFIIFSRLRKCKIIADIPTPRSVVLAEIKSSSINTFTKYLTIIKIIIDGPWVLWPTNKIINYSQEGSWFTIFNKKKSILIGNGIDVEKTPPRKITPNENCNTITLIGVANVEDWHGYDRILKGIHIYNSNIMRKNEINFIIIGDGSGIQKLKELTNKLKIGSQVTFTGQLRGENLSKKYELAHLGVGSLGLHRKGLNFASSLKDREYCATGIPFISTGTDPDFPDNFLWRFPANDTDEPIDFIKIIDWLQSISPIDHKAMRIHAKTHCDYEAKISLMLS